MTELAPFRVCFGQVEEMNCTAVILSADATGLGAVRSLARAGVATIAVALSDREPVLHSRYPRKLVVPPTRDQEASLLEILLRIELEQAVLFPTSDWFVAFICRHEQALSRRFTFAMPNPHTAEHFLDKAQETKLVQSTGIPMPRTVQDLPESSDELVRLLGLPLILKPRSCRAKTQLGRKNVVANTADELKIAYMAHRAVLPRLIAQECIPGPDDHLWVCDCVFDREGELVSAFTFQKLRTAPAHHGVTALGESKLNPELINMARELGRRLHYTGPADFDFKCDARDGTFKYLETNPRLGMCNYFGTACGINAPLAALAVAGGEPKPTTATVQREGVFYGNFFDDAYSRYKDGAGCGLLAPDYFSLMFRRWVKPYFSWRDPFPAVRVGFRTMSACGRSLRTKLFGKTLVRCAVEGNATK